MQRHELDLRVLGQVTGHRFRSLSTRSQSNLSSSSLKALYLSRLSARPLPSSVFWEDGHGQYLISDTWPQGICPPYHRDSRRRHSYFSLANHDLGYVLRRVSPVLIFTFLSASFSFSWMSSNCSIGLAICSLVRNLGSKLFSTRPTPTMQVWLCLLEVARLVIAKEIFWFLDVPCSSLWLLV